MVNACRVGPFVLPVERVKTLPAMRNGGRSLHYTTPIHVGACVEDIELVTVVGPILALIVARHAAWRRPARNKARQQSKDALFFSRDCHSLIKVGKKRMVRRHRCPVSRHQMHMGAHAQVPVRHAGKHVSAIEDEFVPRYAFDYIV